jgi:hypothetical protein
VTTPRVTAPPPVAPPTHTTPRTPPPDHAEPDAPHRPRHPVTQACGAATGIPCLE